MYYTFNIVPPYDNYLFKIRDDNKLLLIEQNKEFKQIPYDTTIKFFFTKELKFDDYIIGIEELLEKILFQFSTNITFNILFNNNKTYFYTEENNVMIIPENLREKIYRFLIFKKLLVNIESFKNIIKTKFENYNNIKNYNIKNYNYNNIKKSLSSLTKKSIGLYYYNKNYSLNIYEDGSLRFYVLNVIQYTLNDVLDKLLDLFIKNKKSSKKNIYTGIDKLSEFKISYRSYGNEKIYIDTQVQIDINFIKNKTFYIIYNPIEKESYFGALNSDLRKEIYKIFNFESNFKKIIKNKFPNYTNNNYNNKNFLSEIFKKKNIKYVKDILGRPIPDTDDYYYSLTIFEDGSFKYHLINDIPYELFLEDFAKVIDSFNKNNSKNIKNTLLNFLSSSISLTDVKYALKDTLIYINFINNTTYFSIYNVINKKYNYINLNIDLTEPMNKVYNNIEILSKIFIKKNMKNTYTLVRYIPDTYDYYYSLTMFKDDGSFKYHLINDIPYELFLQDFSKVIDFFNKNNSENIKNTLLNFLSSSISLTDVKFDIMKDTLIYINFINNTTYFSIYNVINKKYNYVNLNVDLTESMNQVYNNIQILSKIFIKKNILGSYKRPYTNGYYYSLTIFEDGSLKYELLNDMPYQLLSEDLSKNIDSFNKTNKNNINKLLKFLSESINYRDSRGITKFNLYSGKYALKDTIIYINFTYNNTYFLTYNVTDKKYYYISLNLNLSGEIYKKYGSEKILNNKNSFKKIIKNKFFQNINKKL